MYKKKTTPPDKIEVDVMIGDRYYSTFEFKHNPCFKFDIQSVVLTAEKLYPTIKYKDYHLEIGHGKYQLSIQKIK